MTFKNNPRRIRAVTVRMLIFTGILFLCLCCGSCGSFSRLAKLKIVDRPAQTREETDDLTEMESLPETAPEAAPETTPETAPDTDGETAKETEAAEETDTGKETISEPRPETEPLPEKESIPETAYGASPETTIPETFVPASEAAPETTSPETTSPEADSPVQSTVITYDADGYRLSNDASDFVLVSEVVPDVILEIRYYSTYNFVGDRIDGYEEPVALLTKEAAAALKEVSDELVSMGYRLKIYDAYRPQMAVTHFVNWAADIGDTRMKAYFYPELDKASLFPLGYISRHSGHSRGSTVDLTLFDMSTEKEVDMGGTFDYFGTLSHPDYTGITDAQYANRQLLRDVMLRHGFRSINTEWWHFTLNNEPYPDTYFTFPVSSQSVGK